MDYTLLQAHNTTPGDVEDAIRLLAPDWAGGTAVDHSDFWVTVPATEAAASELAPRLAALIGDDVVTTTVVGDVCRMSLHRPDAQPVGPVDGRDTGAATALASALRRGKADEFAAALAADQPAAERHRSAARAIGLPVPDLSGLRRHAGVLVVWAPAATVRSRLPVDGHGAHVVPHALNACLVAPDGSGWSTDPRTHARAFTATAGAPLPLVGIDWGAGAGPTVWVSSGPDDTTLDLAAPTRKQVDAIAAALARATGRAELTEKVAAALDPAASAGQPARALLRVLDLGDVPVGASAEDLAAWAHSRDGAVHVASQAGRTVVLRHAEATVAPAFRRRRELRRVRNAAGVAELAGWAGIVVFVTQGPLVWAAPVIVVIGLLMLLRRSLKRRLDAASTANAPNASYATYGTTDGTGGRDGRPG